MNNIYHGGISDKIYYEIPLLSYDIGGFNMRKRERNIQALKDTLSDKFNDYSYDRFGNLINVNKDKRFKFKKSVVRIERKYNTSWTLIDSFYYKDLCVKDGNIYIIKNLQKIIW